MAKLVLRNIWDLTPHRKFQGGENTTPREI